MFLGTLQTEPDPAEAERCSHCGGLLLLGYGFAGAGLGAYLVCEACHRTTKIGEDNPLGRELLALRRSETETK